MSVQEKEAVLRAFVSVPVPMNIAVGRMLAELRSIEGVSVPNSDLHITLRFLGDVKKDRLDMLISELDVLNGSPSFDVTMKGIGAFPDTKNPKVVWIGLDIEYRFYELLSRITDVLDFIGIDYDKKRFKAHATIGRVRRNSDELRAFFDSYKEIDLGSFHVQRIDVVSSIFTPSGAEHSVLSSIELS